MGLDLLKLAGEFARADQESKAARIQEAGQDIAEKKAFYSAQALNEFGIARDNFAKKEEKYRAVDTQLKSLGTDATKEDIGTALAKAELGSVEFAKLDDEKQKRVIESYYGNIEALDKDGNLVDLNSDIEGKKYRLSGNYNPAPKVPKLEDYYNDEMFVQAEEDIRNNVKGEWTDFINRIRGKDQRVIKDADGTERKVSTSEDILFKLQNDINRGYENARAEAKSLGVLDENPYEFSALESAKASSDFSQFLNVPPNYLFNEDDNRFPTMKEAKKDDYLKFKNEFMDFQPVDSLQLDYLNEIVANTLPEELVKNMFATEGKGTDARRVLTPFGQKILSDIRPIITANTKDMLGQLNMLANSNNDNEVLYSVQNFDSFISANNLSNSVRNELSTRLLTFTDENFKLYFDSKERPYIMGRDVASQKELAIIEQEVGLNVFKNQLNTKLTAAFNSDTTLFKKSDLNEKRKELDSIIEAEVDMIVSGKTLKEPEEAATTNFVPTITDDMITYLHTDPTTNITEVKQISISQVENFNSELKQKFKEMNPESFKLYEEYQLNKKEQAARGSVDTQVKDLFTGSESIDSIISSIPKPKIGQGRGAKDNPAYSEWMENNKEVFNNLIDGILDIEPDKGKKNKVNPEWTAWNKKYKDILKIGKQ